VIEAVIFDLDDTLIHLPLDYDGLFQEFSKIMKTKNVRPLTKTVSKLDGKIKKEILDIWDRAELAVLSKITRVKEGIAVYNKFSKKPKVLVTMQGKALVNQILERFDLTFTAVLTREDSLDRVKQLRTAAQTLGVRLENVLFVGNGEGDQVAAEEVGCQFLKVKG
jgi:phosphoglycolate phosphatase-like HAD superfamily hydrolase